MDTSNPFAHATSTSYAVFHNLEEFPRLIFFIHNHQVKIIVYALPFCDIKLTIEKTLETVLLLNLSAIIFEYAALHTCEAPFRSNTYNDVIYYDRPAYHLVFEHWDETLWIENAEPGEYGSQVSFCPTCGYEAPQKKSSK